MTLELALPAVASTRPSERDLKIRALVDLHLNVVWRSLKRLGVPESGIDDATQQVFLVAARRVEGIQPGRDRAFLLGIALRVALEARRVLHQRREVPIDEAEDEPAASAPPDEIIDENRKRDLFASILERMPAELKEAFVLFELEKLTAPEVAEVLGVPIGTVASRVRRAREYVRRRFVQRGGEL